MSEKELKNTPGCPSPTREEKDASNYCQLDKIEGPFVFVCACMCVFHVCVCEENIKQANSTVSVKAILSDTSSWVRYPISPRDEMPLTVRPVSPTEERWQKNRGSMVGS